MEALVGNSKIEPGENIFNSETNSHKRLGKPVDHSASSQETDDAVPQSKKTNGIVKSILVK